MADFPYIPNPPQIPKFLEHIQKAGVPAKVSQTYLSSVGFKTKNDRYLITILKFIGFLDQSGVPTETWKTYRNKDKAGVVLAAAVRSAYKDLFVTYADAHRKDNEALRNYFSTHTSVAESTLGLIVRTFKALADKANFDDAEAVTVQPVPSPQFSGEQPGVRNNEIVRAGTTTININIQLEIPATDNAEIYEKFFAALKKHLVP